MPQAHVLVDREFYLPRGWTSDPARCQEAGVPAGRRFATKPELARTMLERVHKGARGYDWTLIPLAAPSVAGFEQAVLIRRPLEAPDDLDRLAYYLTFAPVGTPTATVVTVAGQRWTVEEDFEQTKGW